MCYIYYFLNCVTALTCPISHLCFNYLLQSKVSLIPHDGAAEISRDTVGYAFDVMNVHQTPKIQQFIWIHTTIKNKHKNKTKQKQRKRQKQFCHMKCNHVYSSFRQI